MTSANTLMSVNDIASLSEEQMIAYASSINTHEPNISTLSSTSAQPTKELNIDNRERHHLVGITVINNDQKHLETMACSLDRISSPVAPTAIISITTSSSSPSQIIINSGCQHDVNKRLILCAACILFIFAFILAIWGLRSLIDQTHDNDISLTQHIFCLIYVIASIYDIANSVYIVHACSDNFYSRIAMFIFVNRVWTLLIIALCDRGYTEYPIFNVHLIYNFIVAGSVVIYFMFRAYKFESVNLTEPT